MKHALFGLALTAVLAAAGPASQASAADKPLEGVTLRVATFGGAWRDDQTKYIVPKLEELGAKVEYVVGSPQDNLAKLIAARGQAPFDVLEILDASVDMLSQAGVLEPIDYSIVTNASALTAAQKRPDVVPYWITQEVICYDKAKFDELGLPAPTTYADLANPKLAGHVMIPDIASGGGLANFAGVVYAAGGDVNNVAPAFDILNKIEGLKFWKAGGQVVTGFNTGDIYAAVAHTGWCLRSARGANKEILSAFPKIGDSHEGVAKYGYLGVVKGSPAVKAAMMYINGALDVDYQVAFASHSGVVPVIPAAVERLAQEAPEFMALSRMKPEEIDRLLVVDYAGVDVSTWYDQWNRKVAQ